MATKSDIMEYLTKQVNDTDRVFIGYSMCTSERECVMYSATEIIDLAKEEGNSSSEDVEDALSYLEDEGYDIAFLELEV